MSAPLEIQDRLLVRNTMLNLIGQGLPLVVGLVTIPFVVHKLGPGRFGILSLTWVVFGYFILFDLGLSRAVTKFVAEALTKGDPSRVASIVWTATISQAGFGVLGGLVLGAMTPLLVERLLNIPQDLIGEARLSFYLVCLAVPMVLIASSFRGALEAAQRFDLVNAIRVPLNAAYFLLPLLGALLHWRLPGIVALLVASRALALLAHYWLCVTGLPSLRVIPRFQREEFSSLLRFGGWLTVSNTVGPVLVYLERWMIGILLTMEAVAYYTAPFEIVMRLLIIPTSLIATLFPAFSNLGGEAQWGRLEALLFRSIKYVLLILGPLIALILTNAHDILQVWLGSDFARESTRALQILGVGLLVNSVALVPYTLIQAVGRPDVPAKFHLAELPLYLVLVWSMVTTWRITGGALAWSIRVAIDALLLFIAVCHLFPLSPRSLLTERIPQTLALLLLFGWLTAGVATVVTVAWLRFTLTLVVFLATLRTAWYYLLNKPERTQLATLFRAANTK